VTDTDAGPYRCPTPCDPDCEINAHGCHETHDVPSHREHDPTDCAMRTLEGNILWLIDAGWFLQIGRRGVPDGRPPMWFAALRKSGRQVDVTFTGVSVAEAAGKAAEWARGEADAAPKAPPDCRGFRWIGQSFASCDGCGRPAWEHEGELRLRQGATLLGGDDDFELVPWKPGEAEAIKRKWAGR
jgi:hypothetical protein